MRVRKEIETMYAPDTISVIGKHSQIADEGWRITRDVEHSARGKARDGLHQICRADAWWIENHNFRMISRALQKSRSLLRGHRDKLRVA